MAVRKVVKKASVKRTPVQKPKEPGKASDIKQDVSARLSHVEGHLKSIRKMLEEDRSCEDVMIQLSAVRAAVASATRVMLENHLAVCAAEAAKTKSSKPIDDLRFVIQQVIK